MKRDPQGKAVGGQLLVSKLSTKREQVDDADSSLEVESGTEGRRNT